MNTHHKAGGENPPQRIDLGEDEDDFDDGEVEVIRPHGRHQPRSAESSRGRGLHSQPAADDEAEQRPPSKTRIKKQMHELRDLGRELTELGRDQIAQLDIPDSLREALHEMKGISKFGAQRRQIQYIGKLMREIDPAPIVAKLDAWKGKSQQHVAYMHRLERWRDRLLESDDALTDLLSDYPQADAQRLRTLIRNAQRELETQKPPKNYRELFQALRMIIPESA